MSYITICHNNLDVFHFSKKSNVGKTMIVIIIILMDVINNEQKIKFVGSLLLNFGYSRYFSNTII